MLTDRKDPLAALQDELALARRTGNFRDVAELHRLMFELDLVKNRNSIISGRPLLSSDPTAMTHDRLAATSSKNDATHLD